MSTEVHALQSPAERARGAIRAAGYYVVKVWKVLPPLDTDGDMEVLFVGRPIAEPGEIPEPHRPYRARMPDRSDAQVSEVEEGW